MRKSALGKTAPNGAAPAAISAESGAGAGSALWPHAKDLVRQKPAVEIAPNGRIDRLRLSRLDKLILTA